MVSQVITNYFSGLKFLYEVWNGFNHFCVKLLYVLWFLKFMLKNFVLNSNKKKLDLFKTSEVP